jgi:tetratricopeptide (TPR) repeat protein/DNA-binding CsgD family transcriptional regulator
MNTVWKLPTSIEELKEAVKKTRQKDKRLDVLNTLANSIRYTDSKRAVLLAREALSLCDAELRNVTLSQISIKYFSLHKANAMHILCFCLRNTSQSEEGELFGHKAIEIYKQYNDSQAVARVQHIMAFQYLINHQEEKALDLYQKCLIEFERSGDASSICNILQSLGNITWRKRDYTQAMSYYNRGLDIATEHGLEETRGVFLIGIGNLLEDRTQFNEAITHYQEGVSIARERKNDKTLASGLLGLACISKILGDYQKAILYIEETQELFTSRNDIPGTTHCLELLSGIYFEQGKYEQSVVISTQIIQLLEQSAHRRTLAGAWNNIASVYAKQGDFPKSIEKYQKALDIYTTINDSRGICFVHANIAEQYVELQSWESARKYIRIALDLIKEHNYIDLEIEILPVFGKIVIAEKEYDQALLHYTECMEKCVELNHKRGIALLKSLAGDIQKARKNYDEAVKLYQKSIQQAETVGDKPLLSSIHRSLSQVYESLNNSAAALHHFKKYHDIDKELFNENSDKRLKNLQVLHETETAQKERNIFRLQSEQLKAENEFKTKELSAMALHLVQKNETLESLLNIANRIVAQSSKQTRQFAEEMVHQIERNLRDDNAWQLFNQQFTQLHSGFTQTLSDKFPMLTPMEIKICVLLKIHLNTKEIAAALVLSTRTVEDHRNRMRKKFGLTNNENLTTFILGLE